VLTWNALIAAATIGCYGLFTPATPYMLMVGVLLAGGFFRSLQFTSLNALAYADIERERMSAASSLANVTQQLSLSLGVTIGAFILEHAAAAHGRTEVAAGDFGIAFAVVALISASSFWFNLRLHTHAGAEVSGRPPA